MAKGTASKAYTVQTLSFVETLGLETSVKDPVSGGECSQRVKKISFSSGFSLQIHLQDVFLDTKMIF